MPAELLAQGPPPERRTDLPLRLRALATAGILVLAGGVAAATDQEGREPPPRTVPAPVVVAGLTATARVVAEEEFVTRLGLTALVDEPGTGRGDSNGEAEPSALTLVDLAARGFQLRLVGGALPQRLADVGRFGSGLTQQVPLLVDAVVVDCSVEVGAPRRITLSVRRGDGPVGTVVVASDPEVVRALDRLVSRTCRRPRG